METWRFEWCRTTRQGGDLILRAATIAATVAGQWVGAAITLAIVHGSHLGHTSLSLVIGAIAGTQVAAVMHHRVKDAANTVAVKIGIGLTLAISSVVFGVAAQWLTGAFEHVEVSLPIGAIGSFVFPFALFNTFWKALSHTEKK